MNAAELAHQRHKLRGTDQPHPNQLRDLSTVTNQQLMSVLYIVAFFLAIVALAMGVVPFTVLVFVLGVVACLYPAWRAARYVPVEAITRI